MAGIVEDVKLTGSTAATVATRYPAADVVAAVDQTPECRSVAASRASSERRRRQGVTRRANRGEIPIFVADLGDGRGEGDVRIFRCTTPAPRDRGRADRR